MTRPALSVGPLPETRLKEASTLTSAAFVDSPSYRHIFEGLTKCERLAALEWLFERNFELRKDMARAAFDADRRLICSFLLEPPDAPEISLWQMIRSGLLMLPVRFGRRPFLRLLSVKEYYDGCFREVFRDGALDRSRYCTLERMVVSPACQGRGVGSACLGAALQECDDRGLGVVLTTQEPRNARFYGKLGFEVLAEQPATFSPAVTDWIMIRHPPTGAVLQENRAAEAPAAAARSSLARAAVVGVAASSLAWLVLRRWRRQS